MLLWWILQEPLREPCNQRAIVCCVNHIHFICPLFVDFLKAFQSVYQLPYILCYNVLCDFVSLIFSLIRVRNALWEDITQGKQ